MQNAQNQHLVTASPSTTVPTSPAISVSIPPCSKQRKVNDRSNLISVCCKRQVHVSGSSYVAPMAH